MMCVVCVCVVCVSLRQQGQLLRTNANHTVHMLTLIAGPWDSQNQSNLFN